MPQRAAKKEIRQRHLSSYAGSMRGTLDRFPEIRCSTVDGSITGGHATR
jgi:hypothetical protein